MDPHPMRPLWRVLVLIAGLVVVAAGAVMLVTPGPGIAAILLGLTILATEFRWARYYLVLLKRRTLTAARKVRERRRRKAGDEPEAGRETPAGAPASETPREAAMEPAQGEKP